MMITTVLSGIETRCVASWDVWCRPKVRDHRRGELFGRASQEGCNYGMRAWLDECVWAFQQL